MANEHIAIHEHDFSMEKKLKLLAAALNLQSENVHYTVRECYFDFGQDWLWTTIIAERRSDSATYQALYPVQQEKLYMAETFEDVLRVVGEIVNEVVKE